MSKRWTYEEVKEYFEQFGYDLLDDTYVNNKKPLTVKCPDGHITTTLTFDNFKNKKRRCSCCIGNMKYTYGFVKEYIESFGYKLLSDKYVNSNEYLLVQCNMEHEPYNVTFNAFKNNKTRCPYCCGNIKYTIEEIKRYLEEFQYKLLSTEYKNAKAKLEVQCDKGHIYETYWNKIQQGSRCPYCKGGIRYTYEYIEEYIKDIGYNLLSQEYSNSSSKLKIQCDKGHIYFSTWDVFQRGQRCTICSISKGERKIMDWLDINNIKYVYEKKFYGLIGVGNGNLSYDFYLPKYNLLIEYQGNFHDGNLSENYKNKFDLEKQQEHDKRKRDYAKNNNLSLLEIWYWDFDNIEKILDKELKGC